MLFAIRLSETITFYTMKQNCYKPLQKISAIVLPSENMLRTLTIFLYPFIIPTITKEKLNIISFRSLYVLFYLLT